MIEFNVAAYYLCMFTVIFAAWMTLYHFNLDRPVKVYDIASEKYVKIPRKVFVDSHGHYRSYSEYELYFLGCDAPGLGDSGDLVLCSYERMKPGSWCMWWDIISGPAPYVLQERDCRWTFDRTPIIKYVIKKGDY